MFQKQPWTQKCLLPPQLRPPYFQKPNRPIECLLLFSTATFIIFMPAPPKYSPHTFMAVCPSKKKAPNFHGEAEFMGLKASKDKSDRECHWCLRLWATQPIQKARQSCDGVFDRKPLFTPSCPRLKTKRRTQDTMEVWVFAIVQKHCYWHVMSLFLSFSTSKKSSLWPILDSNLFTAIILCKSQNQEEKPYVFQNRTRQLVMFLPPPALLLWKVSKLQNTNACEPKRLK